MVLMINRGHQEKVIQIFEKDFSVGQNRFSNTRIVKLFSVSTLGTFLNLSPVQ